MSAEDEDALTWVGDEPVSPGPRKRVRTDPVVASAPPSEPGPVVEQGESVETPVDDPTDTSKQPLSPVLLVAYGILGGVYLICTIGWVVLVAGSGDVDLRRIDGIMFRVAQGLAIAAPAIWFGGTLLLSRGRRAVTAFGLLVLGLVVTLPWPILITGA